MRDAVIIDAVRTPVGKRQGALAGTHAVDLSAFVLDALTARTGLDPATVDDVVWGCVSQLGEQASNVARLAALAAGWPESVPGTTVDRACGSSQQAIQFAAATVMSGLQDVIVAGGVEVMSRVPIGSSRRSGPGLPYGPRLRSRYPAELGEDREFSQGLGAEAIAARWGFSRSQLDEYSLGSHERAARAQDEGRFEPELAPVKLAAINGAPVSLERDEGVRRNSSLEKLAGLAPSFVEGGVITAGNASQISDGAAAVLITTSEVARRHGWRPYARLHSFAVVGVDPVTMLTGPTPATEKVLSRSGLTLDDIGVFEVNEAFASVSCMWLADIGADPQRCNPNGGAIALGHPLGASGARLTATLVHEMRRTGSQYGLQAMCEGGGMANATILELIA
jgi:acetyl-CoA acyltransferase